MFAANDNHVVVVKETVLVIIGILKELKLLTACVDRVRLDATTMIRSATVSTS